MNDYKNSELKASIDDLLYYEEQANREQLKKIEQLLDDCVEKIAEIVGV
ncbi:hypothetical protein SAMN02745116_02541 [Pilibacter termitis]|uniref:Uncharacterized protein n=1 Tax=Pilibacter termitis TaxID=263852 RepID=A0A1T4RDL4_9ENTE|nr:hypothetical protein [Pilibacter termitis]SKA13721.1 hypothetical protein SAMN02745116_02541 [Pilibacter termitis]